VYSVSQIAIFLEGEIFGDVNARVKRLSPLDQAIEGDISFCAQAKFISGLSASKASVVLVKKQHQQQVTTTAIVVNDPYLAFAQLSQWFDWRAPVVSGQAANVCVSKSAKISATAQICHGAVIGDHVIIQDACYIGPNTVLGNDCIVGANSRLEANVTLYQDVHVGENCILHSGAVIGADGFGFAKKNQGWQKIYQLAGVRIGSDVEIGACTTIDRGALSHTVIGNGVKLDNQVQIAHNVVLGDYTAIAGCTAIAGSTSIGDNCTIAGMSGVTGHLDIAAGTHITAMSLVSRSIKEAGVYSSGTGVEKHQSWKKNVVRFRSLDAMARRIKILEKEMQQHTTIMEQGKK